MRCCPASTHLSVFNASGDLHWSSEMSVDPEVLNLIPETLRAAASNPSGPGQQAMAGQEPVYLFWLRRDDGMPNATPFAIVVLGTRGGADTERRAFSFVYAMVKPAIECLRRELMARDEIMTLHTSMLEQDSDLEMLLSVSGVGGSDNKPESVGDLKAIMASATDHLRAGLAALIVPENGIALMHTPAEAPLDTAVLAKAHRHLLSMARARRQAVVANRMELPVPAGAPRPPIVCSPVRFYAPTVVPSECWRCSARSQRRNSRRIRHASLSCWRGGSHRSSRTVTTPSRVC